ncbi:hypothetical protein MTO96_004505 [Rhipicephalus appendiculatus]
MPSSLSLLLLALPDPPDSRSATTSDQPTLPGVFCSSCCFPFASGILPFKADCDPRPVLALLLDLDLELRRPRSPSLDLNLDLDLDVGAGGWLCVAASPGVLV